MTCLIDPINSQLFFAHLVAGIAEVSEELVVMCFAVGESFLLVVFVTHEWFLAFCADEML